MSKRAAKRTKRTLTARQAEYRRTVKENDPARTKGYRMPGSLNAKKSIGKKRRG